LGWFNQLKLWFNGILSIKNDDLMGFNRDLPSDVIKHGNRKSPKKMNIFIGHPSING